jgi:diguanylate cyclase (GGDEF)-like protein
MPVDIECRRLLLAARPSETKQLRNLFAQPQLEGWDLLEAESFERARFLLLHNACEVLLVDEGLYQAAGSDLSWLARYRSLPVIFLTAMEPDAIARAYEKEIAMCLPRQATLDHPPLLAAALNRAAAVGEVHKSLRRSAEREQKSRRQIDRLVNLLWRNVPMDADRQWFTHRHILERLQEEIARSSRHGTVFTLALGEVEPGEADADDSDELMEWTTAAVSQAKRRCDVAGQYGMRGFMLLLVQTTQPGGVICCKRLQARLKDAAHESHGPRRIIRASFGLSSFTSELATSEIMLSQAESHLQAAKSGIQGGVVAA